MTYKMIFLQKKFYKTSWYVISSTINVLINEYIYRILKNDAISLGTLVYFLLKQGCPELGYDGENCSSLCPEKCKDDQCYAGNKTFLSCVAGYIGSQCIEGTR